MIWYNNIFLFFKKVWSFFWKVGKIMNLNYEKKIVVAKHCLTFHYVKQSKCNVQISLPWLSLTAFIVFIFLVIVSVASTKIKIWLVNQHKNQKENSIFIFLLCSELFSIWRIKATGWLRLEKPKTILSSYNILYYSIIFFLVW